MTVAADVKKKALKTVWHDNHPTSWYTCKINMRKCYRHSEQSLIEKSVKLFRISSNYWYHNAHNFSVKPNRTKIWTFILQFYHSYIAQWWILRNAFAIFFSKNSVKSTFTFFIAQIDFTKYFWNQNFISLEENFVKTIYSVLQFNFIYY